MINQQRIETQGRNCGHTEEDGYARHEGSEFMLDARIVVSKDQENDENGSKTDCDSKAAPEQNAGDDS
jgi:hypothetical protein